VIPFLVVRTRTGFSYIRADRVVAVNANDAAECTILLTDGVTIAAIEPAEDVVARLEDEARQEDDALLKKETRKDGHVPR
jgi:hypothetical protein